MNINMGGPRTVKPGDMVKYIEIDDALEPVSWPALVTLVDPANPTRACMTVFMSEGMLFQLDVEFGTGENNWAWR